MQLFSRNKALAALSLGALVALGACGDDVTVPAPVNPPVQVTMSPSNANVSIGSFVDLAVAITGGASTPTLASCATSNAAVATAAVQGGNACRVTGVAAGSVSITATTSGGQTAGAAVTVNTPAPAIAGLALTPAAANLQVGSSTNGSVTITANPTTQANASVTLSRAFVSSNNAVATVTSAGVVTAVAPGQATITVTLTGSGTGLATAAVTGQVSITVSANPPAVTGVTVTPQSAVLTTGGTQQITATAQAASGITASLTYGTTNPAVANVSASGLITAVGPGTATITVTASSAGNNLFAAATATGTVGVIVNAPAQISVSSITLPNGEAVNIANVTGQITVAANLATNGNNVSSVQLFACSVSATGCPAAGQTPIAQQTFGAAGASSGTISFLVNTAAFTVAPDFSSATTNFPNGQTNIVATITSSTGSSSANANLAVLNVNNTDGFAARHTAPARSAIDASNNVWFGGPGAEGRGAVAIVPVIYTPGRSVSSVSLRMGVAAAVAGCSTGGTTSSATTAGNGLVTFTAASARPWTFSFGASLGTGLNATNIVCTGNSTAPTADVVPQVTTWIDNNNVSASAPAFLNSVATTTPVPAPAIIRGDWAAPSNDGTYTFNAASSFQSVAPGSTWVNGSYSFLSGDGVNANYSASENNGVGLSTSPVLEVAGCGSSTFATIATNTGADLAECATDLSAAAYTIRYRPSDRLGNTFSYTTGTPNNVTTFTAPASASKTFGVDKSAPFIRWSTNTAANSSVFSSIGATTVFSAEAIDDRAGLFSARVATARANNSGSSARAGQCRTSTPSWSGTGIGSSFITDPICSFVTITPGSEYGAALVDGYRPILTAQSTTSELSTLGGEGYYTQSVRVYDRAGNLATTDKRNALINNTVGTFAVTAPATFLSATSGLPVSGAIAASVEMNTLALEAQYGAGTYAFRFPAVSAGRTAFDNVAIASSDAISLNTPFTTGTTFYTDIETVAAAPAIPAPTGSAVAADNVNVWGTNFAGVSAQSGAVTLSGSLISADTRTWTGAAVSGSQKVGASTITRWEVADTTAAFNSPAGGIKARVTTTAAATATPFARVDFYQQLSAGVYSYLGSVEGNASACTSGTCPVYISDNGSVKTWTYVLRSTLNDYLGRTQTIRTVTSAAAANAAAVAASLPNPGFTGATIVAVGVGTNVNTTTFATSTAGRGLLTQPLLLP